MLFFVLLTVPALQAQDDDNTSRLRSCGDASQYPNADVVVVYDSTDVDVQDSGLSYVHMHNNRLLRSAARAQELGIDEMKRIMSAVEVIDWQNMRMLQAGD